jgi:hypothetical protein
MGQALLAEPSQLSAPGARPPIDRYLRATTRTEGALAVIYLATARRVIARRRAALKRKSHISIAI